MGQLNDANIVAKIAEQIYASELIAIAGHVSPDGDAVASCLALAMCIKKLGKIPVVLLESYPARYNFLGMHEYVKFDTYEDIKPDLFICNDCGTKGRLGQVEAVFDKCENTVVIDHHIINDGYGKINYVKAHASSTCEIVFDIVEFMGLMDKDIATALYTGIIFDTGGLRFNSTSPETMRKVATLMEYGIPFSDIFIKTMLVHSIEEVKIFSTVVGKMEFYEDLPIVYSTVTLAEMKAANAFKEDLEGIVEYMLNTKGAEVAVFIYETGEHASKASFRSIEFDVNKIASNWGGGGHVNAAGAATGLHIDKATKEVMEYLAERYRDGI